MFNLEGCIRQAKSRDRFRTGFGSHFPIYEVKPACTETVELGAEEPVGKVDGPILVAQDRSGTVVALVTGGEFRLNVLVAAVLAHVYSEARVAGLLRAGTAVLVRVSHDSTFEIVG